jgi:hypothetical protein
LCDGEIAREFIVIIKNKCKIIANKKHAANLKLRSGMPDYLAVKRENILANDNDSGDEPNMT